MTGDVSPEAIDLWKAAGMFTQAKTTTNTPPHLSFKPQEFPLWSTLTGNLKDRQDPGKTETLTKDKDERINQLKAFHLLRIWHLLAL